MKLLKEQWFPFTIIALSTLAITINYDVLPQRIPTHWGPDLKADQFGNKWPAAFQGPFLALLLVLLLQYLPMIDPKRKNYERFKRAYGIFQNTLTVFFCAFSLLPVLTAKGLVEDPSRLLLPGMGILFAVLGNYMGQLKQNWYAGIRTPWTLSNEEVWNKTHRFGGKLWLVGGILASLTVFVPKPYGNYVFFTMLTAMGVVPIIYSYLVYREVKSGSK